MKENYLCDKHMYKLDNGQYCGVAMPTHVMKKVMKLNAKYNSEIKKLLFDYKEELYSYSWTLANQMDGENIKEQVTIHYALTNPDKYDSVDSRIETFSFTKPTYLKNFYIVDNREVANKIAQETLEEELKVKS